MVVGAVPRAPGRHARPAPVGREGGILDRARGGLAGPRQAAAGLHGRHLAAVLALVLALGGVAAWTLGRSSPQPVAVRANGVAAPVGGADLSSSPAIPADARGPDPVGGPEPGAPTVAEPTSGAGAVEGAGGAVGEVVVVDVAGRVRRPGVATLPAGSRVVDALRHAGGARPGVRLSSLNLARVLVDGEQILVGVRPAPTAAGAAVASDGGGLVNLNTADAAALEELPGVGPVTAEKIISWRGEHGPFTAIEELLDVDGIGPKTLAEVAPHATL